MERMQYGPPPLFKQGVPVGLRLAMYVIAAVILILVDTRLNVLDPVRLGIHTFFSPVQNALEAPFSFVKDYKDFLVSKGSLFLQNKELARRNEELEQEHAQLAELQKQNAQLRALLKTNQQHMTSHTTIAEVLGEGGDPFTRTIAIDKGVTDHIAEGMAVTDGDGLVGQISRVYANQSEVRVITTSNMQVPIQLERTGLRAIIEGDGEVNFLHIINIPADSDVRVGDKVLTSGIDGVYEAGTNVAVVTGVRRIKGEPFLQISARPIASMTGNRFLRIVLSTPTQSAQSGDDVSRWRR